VGERTPRVHAMADQYPDEAEAQQPREVPGPFEGYVLGAADVPVRVRDFSVDGCLVELSFGTMGPRAGTLQIDLPGEGWMVVRYETLQMSGFHTFVKFVRLNRETRQRIERVIDRLLDQPPEDDAVVINGEANDD
jgi:hypothetical protein